MEQQVGKFKRVINFDTVEEKDKVPIHMRWYLIGEKGIMQFVVRTGIFPFEHYSNEYNELMDNHKKLDSFWYCPMETDAVDIGYHSLKEKYSKQSSMPCTLMKEYFGKEDCFYDGSSLQATDVMKLLATEGEEAVWKWLENAYVNTFKEESTNE